MEPLSNTIPTSATNAKSTALQKSLIRELIIGQDPKSYASHCQVIVDAKEPDFRSIKVPALILAGEEDKSAPLEGCQFIHDNLGSSQKELKVMDGVGHWHCVEAGEMVGREIKAFVKRCILIASKAQADASAVHETFEQSIPFLHETAQLFSRTFEFCASCFRVRWQALICH